MYDADLLRGPFTTYISRLILYGVIEDGSTRVVEGGWPVFETLFAQLFQAEGLKAGQYVAFAQAIGVSEPETPL